ncbi:hypothetical protein LJ737_09000 [Hymenobacter sp. 15J16-1T3B]|uniref:DUF4350 domain-containing protein n=1 Tax=Hymenobacter sp. 15J16-1T3B TaxID=2886941 RepID=UPI001D111F1D|nr:DUF4350 domain-containing protein [Hymenobacter sp. 15J16-1T3B]MCC3157376.1 hypothetical protein [Hymenobacter sp. 15J16-1T3B]
MLRSIRWPLTVLGVLTLVWALVLLAAPKQLDWTPTYRNDHKNPLDTYALYRLLPTLTGAPVQATRLSPYEVLQDSAAAPATYFFLQSSFRPGPADGRALHRYLQRGGTVWLAADDIGLDSLWRLPLLDDDFALNGLRDTVRCYLTARALRGRVAGVPQRVAGSSFQRDSLGRLVFGGRDSVQRRAAAAVLAADQRQRPVLVRLPVGRGWLYVCTTPALLSNYGLLHGRNVRFAEGALSYLPRGRVLWDEFYKQGRGGDDSLLRVVLRSPALAWAWYGLLIGGILFALLGARRRQRPVPTLRPLPNTSLQFARTVAGLYRQGRNHQPLAALRIRLFFDYLRTRFQEPVPAGIDMDYPRRLSLRTGVPEAEVTALLARLHGYLDAEQVSETELHRLHQLLTDFRQRAEG